MDGQGRKRRRYWFESFPDGNGKNVSHPDELVSVSDG